MKDFDVIVLKGGHRNILLGLLHLLLPSHRRELAWCCLVGHRRRVEADCDCIFWKRTLVCNVLVFYDNTFWVGVVGKWEQ